MSSINPKKRHFFFFDEKQIVITHLIKKTFEKEEEKEEEKLVSRDKRHVFWSEDECAEKADRGERCVEFDREERRYLFHTCASEIECD